MTKEEAIAYLRTPSPHDECEDCWYSCATLTCDERRRSTECDCGADARTAKHAAIADLLEKTL